MLDGKGNFLPESKRGFPSPFVAFFKIFGLSALFPKSKVFGRYHLGFLSPDLIHEVDVLAGAFMLLRKKVLDEIGLLDEDFFMYGEDIDLSYRIKKAGYKNYFYPDTKIIHYKGESTKKGSLNYVFVFYNAMIIFARKHLSKNNALLFSILIKSAIYIRAFAAIIARIVNKLALPTLDAGMLFGGMFLLKEYWEQNHKYGMDYYSPQFMGIVVPIFVAILFLCLFLSGGYDRPIRFSRIVRGLIIGSVVIIIIYAFLDENWRFSRALIILGAGWSVIATILLRLLLSLLNFKKFRIDGITTEKRVVLVSELEDGLRLKQFITQIQPEINFIGFIHPAKVFANKNEDYLGTILELKEMVEVYQINEVIFSTKNIALQDIIDSMSKIDYAEVDYKIAPEESLFIIGSNSVDDPGDLYTIDINLSIIKPISKRNKRV
ncbi:MAG: glycosyltransferase, partial [Flavobacterium sp.]|nr:glycosyltransferase [Flavobacterium sp.]